MTRWRACKACSAAASGFAFEATLQGAVGGPGASQSRPICLHCSSALLWGLCALLTVFRSMLRRKSRRGDCWAEANLLHCRAGSCASCGFLAGFRRTE